MDEEIDPATWRRYLYRVRQYRLTYHPYYATSCRQCEGRAFACASCFQANQGWLVRNHRNLAKCEPGPVSDAAHVA